MPHGKVWILRVLAVAALVLLCVIADSGEPTWAFALTWGPNGLFLIAFSRGKLRLPELLEPVHPVEPVIYRWLGVGWIKRIVATPTWPLFMGSEPPPKSKTRHELLHRTEFATKGSEICHGATFVLASIVAAGFLTAGRVSAAAWIMAFNMLLNGYPVMLQRANRWRIHQVLRRA